MEMNSYIYAAAGPKSTSGLNKFRGPRKAII